MNYSGLSAFAAIFIETIPRFERQIPWEKLWIPDKNILCSPGHRWDYADMDKMMPGHMLPE